MQTREPVPIFYPDSLSISSFMVGFKAAATRYIKLTVTFPAQLWSSSGFMRTLSATSKNTNAAIPTAPIIRPDGGTTDFSMRIDL